MRRHVGHGAARRGASAHLVNVMHHATPPSNAARAAQLASEGRQDRRGERRRLSAYVCGCLGSTAIGLALIAAGVHSVDAHVGPALFWSGLFLGNLGVFVSIYHWYRSSDS